MLITTLFDPNALISAKTLFFIRVGCTIGGGGYLPCTCILTSPSYILVCLCNF